MGSRLNKNSAAVRKRIEEHAFSDEAGEEYEGSEFGGFGDYFRRKKIKLQNLDVELRAAGGDKPQIFKGVVAHVSGYTQPPVHILHKDLVQHGAGFLQYLDSKTMATHIIASSMPPKKAIDFSKYRIVKPAWVTDSILAGKLLPWTDYRVLDEGPRQKTIRFEHGKMFSQSSQQSPRGYREQTDNSFYTSQFKSYTGAGSPFQPPSASKPGVVAPKSILPVEDMDVDLPLDDPVMLEASSDTVDGATNDQSVVPEANQEGSSHAEVSGPPTEASKSPAADRQRPTENPPKEKAMTSEEHNALLLADPHIRKASTANPDFLKQFYSESRLHHLSAWKAQLKSRMQTLAAERGPSYKSVKRKPGSRRYIMHVDFDSFFCAISLKRAPEYRDKPAVVAHGTGSGSEIASCNYPARKFGVKNGMWMKRAQELCPDLKILSYDFPGYEEASRQFYDCILEIGGVVQSVSIDEALVDISDIVLSAAVSKGVGVSEGSIWREQETADEIATNLRTQVKDKTDCHVSVGIGANILLAKVALRKAKPAGQYQIKPEEVLDILGELKVDDLPGVAYSIGGRLEEIGVKLVKDIRQTSKERLVSTLGPKTGEKLWEYARGIDRVEVGEQPIRKSVSADVNWGIRFISQEEAEEFVRNLALELEKRLLNEGVRGKHLTMKIMRRAMDAPLDPPKHLGHGKCDTFNKSVTFGVATNSGEQIGKEAVAILRSYKFSPGDLRGLGLQMTKLEPLRASNISMPEGSQKKLSFGNAAPPSAVKRANADPIDEDSGSERVRSKHSTPLEDVEEEDPITIDPLTPRKPKVHPALALSKANAADEKARTPLNITGTQFMIPTHPDPEVLAELPQDIRSKLLGQVQRTSATQSREASSAIKSRSNSPALTDELPSDVDPEVFNALPEDMKAEVLASYRQNKRPRGQSVLPQSPRKGRIIRPKEKTTPVKRGIKDLFGRAKEKERQHDTEAGLLQTNFAPDVRGRLRTDTNQNGGADDLIGLLEEDDYDQEFIDELPEDVRKEILDELRRKRLAQKSRLNYQAPPPKRRPPPAEDDAGRSRLPGGGGQQQMKLVFPAPPPKISFAKSSKTALQDVKEMVAAWHEQTRREGPHRADVVVLEKYLAKVIVEERDMDKARKFVKWLELTVEEQEGVEGTAGKVKWVAAVGAVKAAVQDAMKTRGLGPMDFG